MTLQYKHKFYVQYNTSFKCDECGYWRDEDKI